MLLITISTLSSARVHVVPLRSTMRRACASSIAWMNTVLLLVNVTSKMFSFFICLSLTVWIQYAITVTEKPEQSRQLINIFSAAVSIFFLTSSRAARQFVKLFLRKKTRFFWKNFSTFAADYGLIYSWSLRQEHKYNTATIPTGEPLWCATSNPVGPWTALLQLITTGAFREWAKPSCGYLSTQTPKKNLENL